MTARKSPSITPRKKPSQARSQRTVDLLLQAAARVLEERGMEGYTTNAVAERCGVSVGSLYQYFPNKDALTSALVLKAHRETALHLGAMRARLADWPLQPAVEEMVRCAVVEACTTPRLTKLLEQEEDRLPRCEALDEAEAAIQRNVESLLRPYLAGTVTTGQLREAAQRTIAIVQGMVDPALQGRREAAEKRAAAEVARAIIGYLAPMLDDSWQRLALVNLH